MSFRLDLDFSIWFAKLYISEIKHFTSLVKCLYFVMVESLS